MNNLSADLIYDRKQFDRIIKKISSGYKGSMEEFYTCFGKLIYTTAYAVTSSRETADEVVDDVLIKIWQTADTLIGIKNVTGWLYIITINCARDKLRTEKTTQKTFDLPYVEDKFKEIIDNDAFNYYIADLNPYERQILILRFMKDMKMKTIAKVMDKPLSTVTCTYYRSLEKIKKKKIINEDLLT